MRNDLRKKLSDAMKCRLGSEEANPSTRFIMGQCLIALDDYLAVNKLCIAPVPVRDIQKELTAFILELATNWLDALNDPQQQARLITELKRWINTLGHLAHAAD
jgi:hypothetical protein